MMPMRIPGMGIMCSDFVRIMRGERHLLSLLISKLPQTG
jgi:hypothetical protein